jgi:hypothetical protein
LSTTPAAADRSSALQLAMPELAGSGKVIHIRKLARKVLQLGERAEDEDPIWLGPARLQLLWQGKWKWPESAHGQNSAEGLMGGPMLSLELPWQPLVKFLSLEARFCSFRYAYADRQTRSALFELADPSDERQSWQGGLYLNVALGALF